MGVVCEKTRKNRALLSGAKKTRVLGGWKGGWMDGRAGLRIAYRDQKVLPVFVWSSFAHCAFVFNDKIIFPSIIVRISFN